MNFYAAQDQAHRRSRWLILWFVAGVCATIVTLYSLTASICYFWLARPADGYSMSHEQLLNESHGLGMGVALVTGCLMVGGSLYQILRLRGGGAVVARDMGARLVDLHTRDVMERRLINVVQEMAIASGLPVPEIWIMDNENAINAFAAGTDPNNAVVAVTRGTLENLNRLQLQGVVAHEFSHILNGDMRLNVRLLGWLHGLLMISLLGQGMLSVMRHVRVSSSERDRGGASFALVLIVAGCVVWLVGSVGVFFGRMVQAALSRQREFLADASAVQFTRDPDSIAGALIKIGQQAGLSMQSSHAAEARHMFFSSSGSWMNRFLATHPPLEKRIKAVKPQWDGKFNLDDLPDGAASPEMSLDSTSSRGLAPMHSTQMAVAGMGTSVAGANYDLDEAQKQLQQMGLDSQMLGQAHALLLVIALVLPRSCSLPKETAQKLELMMDAAMLSELPDWQSRVAAMSAMQRFQWMDLAMPGLRRFSTATLQDFLLELERLSRLDGEYSMSDFILIHAIQRRLRSVSVPTATAEVRFWRLEDLELEVALIMALIEVDGDSRSWQSANQLYQQWTQKSLPQVDADYSQLVVVLDQLSLAAVVVKQQVLKLVEAAIAADGRVCTGEYELLRVVADAMGLIVPPRWVSEIDETNDAQQA